MELATVSRPLPQPAPDKVPEVVALQNFIPLASWDKTSLQTWKTPSVEVVVGEGSGQYASPFTISSDDFKDLCLRFGFSTRLLRRLENCASLCEHQFLYSKNSATSPSVPSALEVLMTVYENDAFFCLFRYNLDAGTAKCLLFVKTADYAERRPSRASDMLASFEGQRDLLIKHPPLLLNVILSEIQLRAHEEIGWRIRLNNMESQLGVTKYAESLRQGKYEQMSHDFELLNADVARLSKRAADNALSAAIVAEHARALLRLVAVCESYEALPKAAGGQTKDMARPWSESQEEIQCTIKRAELYLEFCKMVQLVLQSQTAILYNRISRQDSQSMKTIAVVTLFFLPSTFVSTVFASGVFNFQATESPTAPQTISQYAWVYLLVCLLATGFTLAAWLVWYLWGRRMLEAARLARVGQGKQSSFMQLLSRLKLR